MELLAKMRNTEQMTIEDEKRERDVANFSYFVISTTKFVLFFLNKLIKHDVVFDTDADEERS